MTELQITLVGRVDAPYTGEDFPVRVMEEGDEPDACVVLKVSFATNAERDEFLRTYVYDPNA